MREVQLPLGAPENRTPFTGERLTSLAAAVAAPPFIRPWLHRFYSEAEADLVLAAAAGSLPDDRDPRTLQRAVWRAILDHDAGTFRPATFHHRWEQWAFFEHWADIPQAIRDQLNEWEISYYLEEVGPGIRALAEGRPEESDQADYTYLLLEEAEELLLAQPAIYLWPCNCRAMHGRCSKSITVCLRFDNSRDIGWEITPQRAVEILRQSDREGLMHTAYMTTFHGHHGICNCCSCCCFPILAGELCDAADLWPVRRYLAVSEPDACTLCARCVKRCPFGAITIDRKRMPKLLVDTASCRGCGLCMTGCPEAAMRMAPRPEQ
jgi:Pyruvate/2-oxoacid:ferredoxin oxidoreductase delta subunit